MTAIKYTPDLADRFYRLSCQGKSIKEIASEFLVLDDIFSVWAKDEDKPEFREAYLLGKQAVEVFYEKMGRENIDNPKFKEGIYKFITGVRFGWSEKSERTVTTKEAPVSVAELEKLIQQKLEKTGLSHPHDESR